MTPRRILTVAGSAELLTLGALLANLVTVHLPQVSSVLGPVHGLAYVLTVIAAVLVMDGRHRVWLLALIPGVGGLLAARAVACGAQQDGGAGPGGT
ncbi:hypothetical protein GCM10011490_10860 [Pseudoclavibacter endophyticus]|uniref:DUF3817 domain-containing protein n=1 Tax=Pseudoclavibacter endophyticus TaxID=1778590 RepID=A0A6H9WSY6_9MICO|nr:hypothetical protein [Pseudoclavibacter endophyticus]KAB1649484.1 hypothetical protein F8O04_04270 [Pseudoclavibacter endophyticus]GGA62265.1 hypothetical protein GCM10011490_10860 [Pseudoclavibacter endophyticus]